MIIEKPDADDLRELQYIAPYHVPTARALRALGQWQAALDELLSRIERSDAECRFWALGIIDDVFGDSE
jgi:hypothetical protein